MKAEKTLKVWSIITMSFSLLLITSLFVTLFMSISVGAFFVSFYEDFTNDLGGAQAGVLYKLFFQIQMYTLTVTLIANQVLMWIRSSILKKNDKTLRKDLDDMKKEKKEKAVKVKKVKKDKKKIEDAVVEEEAPVVEETVVITKTVKKSSQSAAIDAFINKNKH